MRTITRCVQKPLFPLYKGTEYFRTFLIKHISVIKIDLDISCFHPYNILKHDKTCLSFITLICRDVFGNVFGLS